MNGSTRQPGTGLSRRLYAGLLVTLKESFLERAFKVKTAERLTNLMRLRRQNKTVERLVKKTQDGTIGQRTHEPMDGVDEMLVLGDYNAPPSQPSLGPLVRTALAVALGIGSLAGGAGAAMWGYNQLRGNQPGETIETTEGFILDFPNADPVTPADP